MDRRDKQLLMSFCNLMMWMLSHELTSMDTKSQLQLEVHSDCFQRLRMIILEKIEEDTGRLRSLLHSCLTSQTQTEQDSQNHQFLDKLIALYALTLEMMKMNLVKETRELEPVHTLIQLQPLSSIMTGTSSELLKPLVAMLSNSFLKTKTTGFMIQLDSLTMNLHGVLPMVVLLLLILELLVRIQFSTLSQETTIETPNLELKEKKHTGNAMSQTQKLLQTPTTLLKRSSPSQAAPPTSPEELTLDGLT